MKRTGYLRRRSIKNSHSSENRELREAYRDANPLCEFRKWIPELFRLPKDGEEINHIFSVGRRPDTLTNLIHLSRIAHHEFFHAHPIEGRMLSIWVKWKKNEFDNDEFKDASGMFLAGWLASRIPSMDWVAKYRSELMEHFA